MAVNVKKITHERLGSWEKRLVESHATPVLLLGVGHDQKKGQLALCVTEDMTNREILIFLQAAIDEIQRMV